jgi:hypothetical protein
MHAATPHPRLQGRIELMIRLVAPWLDLLLAVGDRVSRVLERDDPDDAPARMAHEGDSAPRGLPKRPDRVSEADRDQSASVRRPSAVRG